MKPELKLGRKVVAWSRDGDKKDKGTYLAYDKTMYKPHLVLIWNKDMGGEYCPVAVFYKHVKPDLSAPPMNGDEVEVSSSGKFWRENLRLYIGKDPEGFHVTKKRGSDLMEKFEYVRHPQPSKRERVIDIITNIQFDSDPGDVADQIDKIYTEDL